MRISSVPLKTPRDTSTSPQPKPEMAWATSSAVESQAISSASFPPIDKTMPPCSS